MVDFKARRHRLELPSTPNSDDPAVLKRAMDQMKRLVQDEFNRLATDFYDFKQTTYNAAIIPLRGVSNIAVTKDQYSVAATWELPDGDEITPTHIRIRILEISPNSWSLYSYPKTSWEFNGLTPGTQYTLQIQLVSTFEATDTFVSTTRNCPSVPVLRTAESDIKAKVFTTDDGVGPPTNGGTNDENITFNFPNTQGTPGTVGGSDCWWEYKIQYKSACAWVDTGAGGAEVDGDVGDVVIDTASAPFTTYPNAIFRLAYREVCNSVDGDWVYNNEFMAVDYANADCLGIVKNTSKTGIPFSTADLFALPSVCQEDGSYLQIVDELTDTEFLPQEPGFKCVEYLDGEWTLVADDTSDTAISGTIFQGLLSGTVDTIANFNAETDFTLSFDIKIPDNALALAGGTGAYTIIDIGGKIKAQLIENTSVYTIQIVVPRDGGGAYILQAPNLAYNEWNQIYYTHDVSEADGRILYANKVEVDRSANAIANDFDGITGDIQINTVNDMQIRKIYGWNEAVSGSVITTSVEIAILALNPIGYWKLDETSGTTADNLGSLGSSFDGTYTGASVGGTAGPDGNFYMYTDGTNINAGVAIPASTSWQIANSGGTVIAFVKPDNLGQAQSEVLVAALGTADNLFNWRMRIFTSGAPSSDIQPQMATAAGASTGPSRLAGVGDFTKAQLDDLWNVYVGRMAGGTATPDYDISNTAVVGTTSGSGTPDGASGPLHIAYEKTSTGRTPGSYAHVAIFNYVLSDVELQTVLDAASIEGWI